MFLRLVSILQLSISEAVFSKSPGNGLEYYINTMKNEDEVV